MPSFLSRLMVASLPLLVAVPVGCAPASEETDESSGAQSESTASPHYDPSPELKAVLGPMVEAKRIDQAGFDAQLKPLLAALPGRANRDTRAIVDVLFRSTITIDDAVRTALNGLVATWGYRLEGASSASDAIATNVTEPDRVFDAICKAVPKCASGSIALGVIDGGFVVTHPALEGRFLANDAEIAGNRTDDDGNGLRDDVFGYNFQQGTGDLADEGPFAMGGSAHGTHVAAIAARGTTKIGLIGGTAGNATNLAKSIDHLASRGARVISFSLSFWSDLDQALAAIDRHPDIVFFESAGNDGKEIGVDPSRQPNSDLASNDRPNFAKVAAADPDRNRQATSNFSGVLVQLAAVGPHYSAIPTDLRKSGYDYTGKTSQATPAVANLASRVRLLAPELGPTQVKDLLVKTSDQTSAWRGVVVAGGLVNPLRAERVAALVTLRKGGLSAAAAFDKLDVPSEERRDLAELAEPFIR
jgi:hypothetical protein